MTAIYSNFVYNYYIEKIDFLLVVGGNLYGLDICLR